MEVFANVVRTYFQSTKSLVKDMPKEFFEEKATLLEGFLKALNRNDLPEATELLRQSIEAKPSDYFPRQEDRPFSQLFLLLFSFHQFSGPESHQLY